jgi:hypothetical protein
MENSQFEEWLADYEAELREGVQKRFGLTDGSSDKNRLSDESLQDKDEGRAPRIGNMICGKCSGQLACLTVILTNCVTPSPWDYWRKASPWRQFRRHWGTNPSRRLRSTIRPGSR